MSQPPPSPLVFTTSQPRELLACVEFSAELSERVGDDKGAWRWLVVAMTLGVQNACLCALDALDAQGTKAMSRADASEVARWSRLGRSGPPPRAIESPRIVSVLELVRRVGDGSFLPAPYQLSLSPAHARAFDDLVDLRNTFLHFSQDGWSIDLTEIPAMLEAATGIIRHLAVVQPLYLVRAERGHRDRVEAGLQRIEAAMAHFLDDRS